MKRKGFTIIELLAVLVVLGILMIFAVPAIFKTEEGALNKIREQELKNIKDACNMVAIDLDDYMSSIYNCKTGSWVESKCTKNENKWETATITMKDLIDHKYFEDKQSHCTRGDNINKEITITKGIDGKYDINLSNVVCM